MDKGIREGLLLQQRAECSALAGPFLKPCGVSGLFGHGGSRELRAVQVTEKCVCLLYRKKKKVYSGFSSVLPCEMFLYFSIFEVAGYHAPPFHN